MDDLVWRIRSGGSGPEDQVWRIWSGGSGSEGSGLEDLVWIIWSEVSGLEDLVWRIWSGGSQFCGQLAFSHSCLLWDCAEEGDWTPTDRSPS